jgi:hypothetical protein
VISGSARYPADEVDIFPRNNREMTASGNIFGQANIDPALWSCEARLFFSGIEGGGFTVQLCDASNTDGCTPCIRPFEPGALHVIFPNAHLWLSQNWNSAQDYYQARSCSSDLSTCIANFEGLIDAFSFNAASGSFVPRCQVQSADRDSHRPLPYRGRARRLHDADGCFIGTTPQPSFDVTTFFPNYRDFGACAAVGPAAAASCAYTPGGADDDGDDDEKDEMDDEKDDGDD